MVLPEEALKAVHALVATHLRVAAIHVRAQVRAIKESLATDITAKLIGTLVQPLVLDVARIREEVFAADFARFVRRELGFMTATDVIVVDAVVGEHATTSTAVLLSIKKRLVKRQIVVEVKVNT